MALYNIMMAGYSPEVMDVAGYAVEPFRQSIYDGLAGCPSRDEIVSEYRSVK